MPVTIRGRSYTTVAERLEAAHGERPVGITSIETGYQETPGGHAYVRAVVTFGDGSHYTGMASVPWEAASGAEGDAPLEVAETSAVGRALAMAGYPGNAEGLAGAEEMRKADRRKPRSDGRAQSGTRVTEWGKTPDTGHIWVEVAGQPVTARQKDELETLLEGRAIEWGETPDAGHIWIDVAGRRRVVDNTRKAMAAIEWVKKQPVVD